jgi:dipeptidase D
MSQEIRNLKPKAIWNFFADINAIPRASKKEENIIAHMVAFGKKLGLETKVDAAQNVLIRKAATQGMEHRKTVVLQAHLDMVHQKNTSSEFDFETQGIAMEISNGWVHAKETTLGADNGIGVAAIMGVLASKEIPHPSIEALFTVDEETGMTGAMGLAPGYLDGDILLNLDTEDDDEISIGCAGGVDITATETYQEYSIPSQSVAFQISVCGLQGGHSGMDIHKGLGNANKIMNRLLWEGQQKFDLAIANFKGGGLRNAIPRECKATIVLHQKFKKTFEHAFSSWADLVSKEFQTLEKNLCIELQSTTLPDKIMAKETQKKFILSVYACHDGIFRMSPAIPDLVETSNNLARITLENGTIEIANLCRSFSESGKKDLTNAIRSTFELADFKVNISGDYPGWEPNTRTEILAVLKNTYENMFGAAPNIQACHAGLECGILGRNYPDMEMISFGPTIKGAHSPDEKVNISSTQKFWAYLKEILKNIPKK